MFTKLSIAKTIILITAVFFGAFGSAIAQTPKSETAKAETPQTSIFEFTYQGKLTNGSTPANGLYDFKFRLLTGPFDSNPGAFIDEVILTSIPVTNGIFTVNLDFGPSMTLPGDRQLEIWATNTGVFTVPMLPRQRITSTPSALISINSDFALRARNSEKLGDVAANQYVQTSDSRLTDARTPTAGSDNYIQSNGSTIQAAGFSIDGVGKAARFDASRYSINGGPALSVNHFFGSVSVGSDNLRENGSSVLIGVNSGNSTSTGGGNTIVGAQSGSNLSSGARNTLIGFGVNTTTTGSDNVIVGWSGRNAANGSFNSALGTDAGFGATNNTFNTAIGAASGSGDPNLSYATAVGAGSWVTRSNSLVLGSTSGVGTNVGIGTTAPDFRLHVVGQEIRLEGSSTLQPRYGMNFASGASDAKKWYHRAASNQLVFALLNDAETLETPWLRVNRTGMSVTGVSFESGPVSVGVLGSAGSTSLCRNASNEISGCSSSIRYKNNVQDFRPGLNLIRKLRPVTFNWKADNKEDMGLVAEEVNAAEPLLTTTNKDGEVEGVKYDRVGVVLVNAVNEQQDQIEAQQKQIDEQKALIEKQQKELDALKKLICAGNEKADVCRAKEQK